MMMLLDRATGVRCLSSLHVVRLPLALFQPLRMGMPLVIGWLLGAGVSWAMVGGTAHAQSAQEASRVGPPAAPSAAPSDRLAVISGGAKDSITPIEQFRMMVRASRERSYSGVFMYRQGDRSETARIARLVDASGARERVEILDGSPREIVLDRGEVECYLPDVRRITIESVSDTRSLLPIIPPSAEISASYTVQLGEPERIAGFDCLTIDLVPRDAMRYGQRYWIDRNSHLLVKAQMLDENHQIVEQIVFTQLQVGGPIDPNLLKPGFDLDRLSNDWRVERSRVKVANFGSSGWSLTSLPSGFRKTAEITRDMSRTNRVGQIVVSDGISAVSIFIEPAQAAANGSPIGLSRAGAFHVFKRQVEDYVITAVGEAPASSVRKVAEGLELHH